MLDIRVCKFGLEFELVAYPLTLARWKERELISPVLGREIYKIKLQPEFTKMHSGRHYLLI